MSQDSVYTLSQDELKFWEDNSFIVIRGILADRANDLQSYCAEIESWTKSNGTETGNVSGTGIGNVSSSSPSGEDMWMAYYEYEDPTMLSRVENFLPHHAELNSVVTGRLIMSIVDQLVGETCIIYKDRVNFKFPGGGPHDAHQDALAFEKSGMKEFEDTVPYISLLLAVDPTLIENGCLEVPLGWNIKNLTVLPMEAPFPERPNYYKMAQDVEDSLDWVPFELSPGDLFFFTERLPHRSKRNNSNLSRRIIYTVYNPTSEGDKRTTYYNDKGQDPDHPRYLIGNPHSPKQH